MPAAPTFPQTVAVVDLGSNTTRLLLARVKNGEVEQIERRTTITRLAQGVDKTGRLAEEAIERVTATLSDYRRAIDAAGAAQVTALATSAVRDAANGPEFRALLHDRFAIDVRIITGDEEAGLTFLGATSRRAAGGEPVLVLDIGGGSTEFVVGAPGAGPSFAVSTQIGAVRQTERHLHDDPPRAEQLEAMAAEVRAGLEAQIPEHIRTITSAGIAVAGTATSLAAVEQELDPYDPARVDGYRLTRAGCERTLERLAALPLAERRAVPGLHPDRAPTIVAGTVVLVEAMRAFGLDALETSEADILNGAALRAAAATG